jgi:hypothetical protein
MDVLLVSGIIYAKNFLQSNPGSALRGNCSRKSDRNVSAE